MRPIEIEQMSEAQGSKHIAEGERQYVPADVLGFDVVEIFQHQSVSEEDRIIEKGLRTHEREADKGTLAVGHE